MNTLNKIKPMSADFLKFITEEIKCYSSIDSNKKKLRILKLQICCCTIK